MHLASGDEQTDGAWVPVLEVVEAGSRDRADSVRDSLASGAREAGNNGGGTRGDSEVAEVSLDAALSGVGGRVGGHGGQLREVNLAVAGEAEGRGLELVLLGEEEDKRASASVGLGDVEVEDGADVGGDGAVVGCAERLVRRRGGDRDDQVRVLVLAVEVGWAALGATRGGRSRSGLSSGGAASSGAACWASWACGGASSRAASWTSGAGRAASRGTVTWASWAAWGLSRRRLSRW